jgi:hypothetical protein
MDLAPGKLAYFGDQRSRCHALRQRGVMSAAIFVRQESVELPLARADIPNPIKPSTARSNARSVAWSLHKSDNPYPAAVSEPRKPGRALIVVTVTRTFAS